MINSKQICITLMILLSPVFLFGKQQNCNQLKKEIDSLTQTIDKQNYQIVIKYIELSIKKNKDCFKDYEIQDIYENLADNTLQYSSDGDLTFCLKKKAILKGYHFFLVLEDKPALFLKDNYPNKYRILEHLTDSVFLTDNPNVNIQLAFVLRSMIRRDQEVRVREIEASKQKNKKLSDSLYVVMRKVDALNEELLGEVFRQYGYPGYSIVGSEHNACSLLMHHMSTDFQVKYIHLLDNAVKNQELFENLNFLIDKILYKKYQVTLYGTHWSNNIPESNLDTIAKYRTLLKLE